MTKPPLGMNRRAGDVTEHIAGCSAFVQSSQTRRHATASACVPPNWVLLGALVNAIVAGLAGASS
jgi:hypothetical protein